MLTQCVMLHVMRMELLRWQPHDLRGMGCVVIVGFKDRANEAFYCGDRVASFSGFAQTASRKLNPVLSPVALGKRLMAGERAQIWLECDLCPMCGRCYCSGDGCCADPAINDAQPLGGFPCASILVNTAYGSVLLPEARNVLSSFIQA